MSILQAYQADLLKDVSEEAVLTWFENCVRLPICGKMIFFQHETERESFLLDDPLSPAGLFSDLVNTVIDNFRKKRSRQQLLKGFFH
jgi:hypothetical protein